MAPIALWRRAVAELVGTALLVIVVVGSGIMAATLSPDVGIQLLANSIATAFGLAVIIFMVGPVSGAHLNPLVSMADWWLGRRHGLGLTASEVGVYGAAQVAGAVVGAVIANVMFDLSPVSWSQTARDVPHLWVGEVVATAGLILLVFSLARSGRAAVAAPAIGAYIGAAYWFTSSTSFANPAVAVGRAFTDTFAGIAPSSLPGFVVAELVGMVVGVGLLAVLYPRPGRGAEQLVLPREEAEPAGAVPAGQGNG